MHWHIYDDLAKWYPLLDPVEDHVIETSHFLRLFRESITGDMAELLELGSGAGNNAWHLKTECRCVLVDLSESMLSLSRAQNPECEHLRDDMRTVRLDRTFDAILLHDAVAYMTSEEDLRAAIMTAWIHTRAGGAAIFAPDFVAETFQESFDQHKAELGRLTLSGSERCWDPDPEDTTYQTHFSFELVDGDDVKRVEDTHVEGLFSRATWLRLLREAGFDARVQAIPLQGYENYEVFVCRKDGQGNR